MPIINSLAPGRFKWNFGWVIFILVTDSWVIACKIPLSWMSLNLTYDKSILVQVMAWCRQATSHYLDQCWPRSMSPYGVTRPLKMMLSCYRYCRNECNAHEITNQWNHNPAGQTLSTLQFNFHLIFRFIILKGKILKLERATQYARDKYYKTMVIFTCRDLGRNPLRGIPFVWY